MNLYVSYCFISESDQVSTDHDVADQDTGDILIHVESIHNNMNCACNITEFFLEKNFRGGKTKFS